MRPFTTIAAGELRAALRGRMLPALGALFGMLALAIALGGLGASGQVLVQGFARTGVSLLNLAVYFLPLLGLVMGATVFGPREDATGLLLAQPVPRASVLLGRLTGLGAALVLVAAAGFGPAALLVVARTGVTGLDRYLAVAFASTLAGLAGLGLGTLLGILATRRSAAVGAALAVWLFGAVLYDLAAIAILQLAGSGRAGGWLVALLALNPIDGARTLGLGALGADVLLGPPGSALQALSGGASGLIILSSLAAWILAPVGAAAAVFHRRDF